MGSDYLQLSNKIMPLYYDGELLMVPVVSDTNTLGYLDVNVPW
jgi:hypothetical protein